MEAELGFSDQDGCYGFLHPINISVFIVSIFQTQIENILDLGKKAYNAWNFDIQKAFVIINLFSDVKSYSEQMQDS